MKPISPVRTIVALLVVATSAVAQQEMVAGHIRAIKVEGTAWQMRGETGHRERLTEGDFLNPGNAVVTSDNSRVILLFQNGSTVNLQPGTRFSIDEFLIAPFDNESVDYQTINREPSFSTTKVRVDEGTITAKVAKLKRESSYDIVTPLGTAGIRGTVVTVSVTSQSATFVVTQGMVQVTKDGRTFWVSEGAEQGGEGDTRTGREGSEADETIIISTEEGFTPPAGEAAAFGQQGQEFAQETPENTPADPFGDAPPAPESPGPDSGGGGGGTPPPLPGGFGGGGGGGTSGGGNSGGGGIYSN